MARIKTWVDGEVLYGDDLNDEFDAVYADFPSDIPDVTGKADKVAASPDPTGYVATFDSGGNLDKSDQLVSAIGNVSSTDITTIVKLTQAEYDGLSPVDPNTLYIIVEAGP
ncbi:MAG: hypothetical protein WC277_03610 [Bacilli bacterium]|jgi:hypothetical protein